MGVQYTRWPFSILVSMRARLKSYLCLQSSEKNKYNLGSLPKQNEFERKSQDFSLSVLHHSPTPNTPFKPNPHFKSPKRESIIQWPTWNNLILEGFLDCSQDVAQIYSEAVLKLEIQGCWNGARAYILTQMKYNESKSVFRYVSLKSFKVQRFAIGWECIVCKFNRMLGKKAIQMTFHGFSFSNVMSF